MQPCPASGRGFLCLFRLSVSVLLLGTSAHMWEERMESPSSAVVGPKRLYWCSNIHA